MTKKHLVLKELKVLEKKRGYLDPKDVIEVAKNPKSILHTYFEWDDKKAGYEYRLWQARQLIARVRVEYVGKKADAFWNARVRIKGVKVQGYFGIEKVFSDEELKLRVLEELLSDIRALKKKYKEFKEVDAIINEEAVENLSRRIGL